MKISSNKLFILLFDEIGKFNEAFLIQLPHVLFKLSFILICIELYTLPNVTLVYWWHKLCFNIFFEALFDSFKALLGPLFANIGPAALD